MHGNSLKTLRQDLLARRKQFSASAEYLPACERVVAKVSTFLGESEGKIRSIALYYPIHHEVDLRPMLRSWAHGAPDRTISLPFARSDKHLEFYAWQENDLLIPSQQGIPEPDPNNPRRPQISPDCIFIPCIGWTTSPAGCNSQFWRLGYGGGYFDRTLAKLRHKKPELICVGIGFDWQRLTVDQWKAQAHDEPLNALITESGIQR